MDVAEPHMAKKKEKPATVKSAPKAASADQRTYTIPDHRLEKPSFSVRQVRKDGKVAYEVSGRPQWRPFRPFANRNTSSASN